MFKRQFGFLRTWLPQPRIGEGKWTRDQGLAIAVIKCDRAIAKV